MALDHSQHIVANISVKEKVKQVEENQVDDTDTDKLTKFRCFKCKDTVSLEKKFNDEDQM